MSKELRKVIIMILVLIALIGGYFLIKNMNAEKQAKEDIKAQESIVTVKETKADDITGFSYLLSGEEIAFVKKDSNWYLEKDNSIPIDQDGVSTLLQSISVIEAQNTISQNDIDQDGFGLNTPTNVIRITTKSGTDIYTFGIQNSLTQQYYLQMNDETKVYCVSTTIPTDFSKTIESLTVSANSASSNSIVQ